MGLDLYWNDCKQDCLLTLSKKDIDEIKPSFLFLQKQTGVFIDIYSTTRIYPDHAKLILSEIKKNGNQNSQKFISILEMSVNQDKVLLLEGD